MKSREETHTVKIERALRSGPEFQTVEMLKKATGESHHNATSSLWWLRRCRVVDVVIEVDGVGWWFALPPEDDLRSRIVEERKPETRPRNRRIRTRKLDGQA